MTLLYSISTLLQYIYLSILTNRITYIFRKQRRILLMVNYFASNMSGALVGIFAFFLAYTSSIIFLRKYRITHPVIFGITLVSLFGHAGGALFYYWYSLHVGSDSVTYFNSATLSYNGIGFNFVCYILGYLKTYILNDSFLGAFLVSGALGYLGSIFYFLSFKQLFDMLLNTQPHEKAYEQTLIIPAIVLLCWPSYFIWSAGLIKDSFTFILTGYIFLILANSRRSVIHYLLLFISCLFVFSLRPYLFGIAAIVTILYVLLDSKADRIIKSAILFLAVCATVFIIPKIQHYLMMMAHDAGVSMSNIGTYIIYQQSLMQEAGSSLSLPTYNPNLVFLYLPYLIGINLFLPMGVGATSIVGWLSSIENVFLAGWVLYFLINWSYWKIAREKLVTAKYLFVYFIFGISCLSIMNTNLGLAMRQKMMYVPAFLIAVLLVYSYKKVVLIRSIELPIPLNNMSGLEHTELACSKRM